MFLFRKLYDYSEIQYQHHDLMAYILSLGEHSISYQKVTLMFIYGFPGQ